MDLPDQPTCSLLQASAAPNGVGTLPPDPVGIVSPEGAAPNSIRRWNYAGEYSNGIVARLAFSRQGLNHILGSSVGSQSAYKPSARGGTEIGKRFAPAGRKQRLGVSIEDEMPHQETSNCTPRQNAMLSVASRVRPHRFTARIPHTGGSTLPNACATENGGLIRIPELGT